MDSTMNTQQLIDQVLSYLAVIHELHADGCKSTCHEREVGYHHSTYYGSYWYARFGGYCIADLTRQEEIRSEDLDKLYDAVKSHIETALKRYQEET